MVELKQNLTGTITSAVTKAGFRDLRSLEQIAQAPSAPEAIDYLKQLGDRTITGSEDVADVILDIAKTIVERKITQIENTFTRAATDIPLAALGAIEGVIQSKIDNTFQKLLPDTEAAEMALHIVYPEVLKHLKEPVTPFKAQYPYNNVITSESGHMREVDDTPGAERIHEYHRSGSFTETHPDGTKVNKIVGDGFTIVVKDKNVMVEGNANIIVNGNANISVGKNLDAVVTGSAKFQIGGNADIMVNKDANMEVRGNAKLEVKGNLDEYVQGNYTIKVSGNYKVTAARIDLN